MHKSRIAFALKCKPEEVPEKDIDIKQALENRRAALKEAKLKKVNHGESVH
ncbi:MAG: hypothetical protein PHU08_07175 [Dehalococcoidales bacterium]|nr:hypothetical protein [Dehalococcoidales bacterium]